MLSCIPAFGDEQLFSVVRVEATKKPDQEDTLLEEEKLEFDEIMPSFEDAVENNNIEVGQGVAIEMKTFGSSVLRGSLVRLTSDSTKWIAEFSNMRKLKLSEEQVVKARQLFQEQVALLLDAKVPKVDALSPLSEATVRIPPTASKPVLSGDTDTDMHELKFEEHYQGSIPDTLIGIVFSSRRGLEDEDGLLLWESVLRNLALKLLDEGVKPVFAKASIEPTNDQL